MIVLESTPVGPRVRASACDVTIVVDADLEREWSGREEKLSVEISGGVGEGVCVWRLSIGVRRSRRRSTDMVAERIEKEGSIGWSRMRAETRSPGPTGEERGGVENAQWYIGRWDLGDWRIGSRGGGEIESEREGA